MKKKITAAAGIALLLLSAGCQSGSSNAETEALKDQIAQLEQQINALEQQNTATDSNKVSSQEPAAAENNTSPEPSPAENNDAQGQYNLSTTHTIEELTSIVNAFIEKVDAAALDGTSSDNMEQFFSLKQEEKQIDDALDLHEDELETLYRQNALTRDEYKSLEQELERLADNLDDAEDRLEYIFGIND